MLGDGVEDDVAVLAVRAHPVDAARPAEAGPEVAAAGAPPPGLTASGRRLIAKAVRKPTVVIRPVQAWVFSNASGIMVSAIMVRIAPAATAVITALDLGRRAAEQHVAEQRGQAAGHGDRRSRRRRRTGAERPLRFMPAALERPSGTLEMKTAASTDRLTPPPAEQAQPQHDGLGDAVEQRADRDGGTAAGLLRLGRLLVPRPLAVPGAVPGEDEVRREVDDRAAEEAAAPWRAGRRCRAASSMRSNATAEMSTPDPNAMTDATTFGGTAATQAIRAPMTSAPPPSRPQSPASSQVGIRSSDVAAPRVPPRLRRSGVLLSRVAQQVPAEVRDGERDLARARPSRPGPS